MSRAPWLVVSFALFFLSSSRAADKRPMTVDDALDMTGVGQVVLSPDGSLVLFQKRELDWKENRTRSKWFAVPFGGQPKDAFQYLGDDGGSSLQFSDDGRYLAMLRPVDGKSQVFWMRTSGGEAVQLTKHPEGVSRFRWSRDASRIFFLANREKSEEEKKKHKQDDAIFVDEPPNGQSAGNFNELWVFDVESKTSRRLTSDKLLIGDFDVAPDGERVVFTARRENRRNQGNLSELYLLTVPDGVVRRLTRNEAPENDPVFAPDGKGFAYSAPDDEKWELRNSRIWYMDADTGESRFLSQKFEGSPRGYTWTPDSKGLLFVGAQRTESHLFRLDLESGDVTRLSDLGGSMGGASFSRDRTRVAFTRSDYDSPSDVYVAAVDPFDARRVTALNDDLMDRLYLAKMRVIRWKSKDGMEIEGLLHLPQSYREGQRVPLMLNIHGGPAGVFTDSFRASYHIYAGLGFASLSPNVRGSSAYSDDLLRGNMFDIGGGDYEDLMTGVDHVIGLGIADPERLALRGWSYGGILGGFTLTKTDRFKAASIGAGVYDWTSEYGPGFNYDVRLWYIGGTPWENPDGYRQKSTLTHVVNITTPVILFHGMNDTTDTEAQSMMLFAALKDLGRDVRYIRFPREGHGIREPRHQRVRDVEEIRFVMKRVLGQDWTPPERKEEKASP